MANRQVVCRRGFGGDPFNLIAVALLLLLLLLLMRVQNIPFSCRGRNVTVGSRDIVISYHSRTHHRINCTSHDTRRRH